MEEKKKEEILKMEDTSTSGGGGGGGGGFFPFSDTTMGNNFFDFSDDGEKWSVGFMELLGINNNDEFKDCCSEIILNNNLPATPNSSSVSSASSDAADHKPDDDDPQHKPTQELLKGKKRKQKKEKETRFAFMTKSEVDHLEDGYRWRKYGQKAVKNSPFPRSYYRCTSSACGVKKRVERSFADPTIVVTTYEGQHTHPSPILTRSALAFTVPPLPPVGGSGGGCGGVAAVPWLKTSNVNNHDGNISTMSHPYFQTSAYLGSQHLDVDYNRQLIGAASAAGILQEKRLCMPNPSFLGDHGLLQDVVPPNMLKQE